MLAYNVRMLFVFPLVVYSLVAGAAEPKPDVPDDPDFAVQGEYRGEVTKSGAKKKIGVQVVTLGKGKFRAVAFEGGYAGQKKEKPARMTVRHNGGVIHSDVEVPHATTSSPLPEGPEPGPLNLQEHGSEVRFRNIWFLPKSE